MDLASGFQIENPSVFVPWGVNEQELLAVLPVAAEHVTTGYYVIDCTSLSGLDHALGFHFRPREHGHLHELEFFRRAYPDQGASFAEFQEHLEATFGPPSKRSEGLEGFPNFAWQIGPTWIKHYVFDRFGPEEHVRIGRS